LAAEGSFGGYKFNGLYQSMETTGSRAAIELAQEKSIESGLWGKDLSSVAGVK